MNGTPSSWQELLKRLASSMNDNELATFLTVHAVKTDDDLADAIDIDARARDDENSTVDLHRYMTAVPGLPARPVVLDTALEAALRSMRRAGIDQVQAVAILEEDYPKLSAPIRTCAMLDQCVVGTTTLTAGVATAQPLALPCGIGEVIEDGKPRYELRDIIGRGNQAVVYLSVDRRLSVPDSPAWVAIKVMLHPAREAWLNVPTLGNEAHAARRINHPNVVRVLDRGLTADGREFVVYEYIRGATLHESREKRTARFDADQAARAVVSIARGLQAAHSAAVLHCDLKPSNVLLADDGTPKIADFGLARHMLNEESADGPVGSFAFMSPEQFSASSRSTMTPADIYSLGGVLYWMLTDLPPNGSDGESVANRLRQGESAPPISPAAHRPELDPDLSAICTRALHPRPEQRYASAEALAVDLETYLQHRPLAWAPCPPARRARLAYRRSPRWFAVAALAGLTAVGATVWAVAVWHNASVRSLRQTIDLQKEAAGRQSAEIESAKEAARNHSTTQYIGQLLSFMRTDNSKDRPGENWLTATVITEDMFGGKLMDTDEMSRSLWPDRISIARRFIEEAERQGRGRSINTLLWKSQLGFWLVKKSQFAEAGEVLRQNIADWKVLQPADDPYIQDLEALLLASRYGQMRGDPAAEPAKTAAARQAVEAQMAGPLHDPVRKTLQAVLMGP